MSTQETTEKVHTDGEVVDTNQEANELSAMIDSLLNDLTEKFTNVATELTSKMDDMSRRIDGLEASIQAQKGSEPNSTAADGQNATS